MANSDYSVTAGAIPFCPNGVTSATVQPLDTTIPLSVYRTAGIEEIVAGEAAMINDEIVKVVAFTSTSVTVARGCADTIPQQHPAGSIIWFFNDSFGSDAREYAGSETVSVKLLPKTASAQIPIEYSDPDEVTFNFRFARPYPPGNVKTNGQPFTSVETINSSDSSLDLTWAHRDRVSQFDQLIDHSMTDVGPEAGVSYTIKVHKADNTVVRTVTGISGTSWSYDLTTARSDFGITPGAGDTLTPGYITLESVRDTYASWQKYRINFQVSN